MSKLLPGIVACNGAIVVASENSDPKAALVLKLRTEGGQEVLLPLSERATKQVQKVISEFNRSRDLLFVEERPVAAAPLQ
jgi:hypothetical protein